MSVQRIGPSISALLASLAKAGSSSAATNSSTAAGIDTTDRATFASKLEKHLSDYRSGNGNLSSDIGAQLDTKGDTLATNLDPKNLTRYSGYVSGLSYSARARFVNNLSDSVSRLKNIYG